MKTLGRIEMLMIALIVTAVLAISAVVTHAYFADVDFAEARNSGLVTIESVHDVPTTTANLESVLLTAGFGVPLILDHQANAASVGKVLRPTTLIVFGNPNVGTQFMQANQLAAIDFPQKFLIWEDSEGLTHITWNDPDYILSKRHHIKGKKDVISNIAGALASFASQGASE